MNNIKNVNIAATEKYLEKEFWLKKLSDFQEINRFQFDLNSKKEYKTIIYNHPISNKLSDKIIKSCKRSPYLLHALTMSCIVLLIHEYTSNDDVIIGTPTEQQNCKDRMYNRLLLLRKKIEINDKFQKFLGDIKFDLKEAIKHQNYPIDQLFEKLNISNNELEEIKIFDIGLVIENIHTVEYLEPYKPNIVFKFDINSRNLLDFQVLYNSAKYKGNTIKRICHNLTNIIALVIDNPQIEINKINCISNSEKDFIIDNIGGNDINNINYKTLIELFQENVIKNPDRIALVYNQYHVTYKELSRLSDKVAAFLIKKGVSTNNIVALHFERSINMIAAILGTIKAKGVFLPIHTEYPNDRKKYMIEDSKTKLVLTDDFDLNNNFVHIKVYNINQIINDENIESSIFNSDINDLVYILYTSGTSGKPKATMVTHKNVSSLLNNTKSNFYFDNNDIWIMLHSYCFDFSVWEMFGALCNGCKLILITNDISKDIKEFVKVLIKRNITILNQTPSFFYLLSDYFKTLNYKRQNIKYIIFGGEALNFKKLEYWNNNFPDTKLINMYGITETTIHVTYKEINEEDIKKGIINIGRPIKGYGIYIMSTFGKIAPIGVQGEIYVKGEGVSNGYLGNKKLTEERFIKNPFCHSEILYKSGDLGKILPNGEIEYLGRCDKQVKIRGFRIEIGEIEYQIQNIPGIKDNVVIEVINSNNEKFLCAYIISEINNIGGYIKEILIKNLPDYMIPTFIIEIKSIPLTVNGKLDIKSLPNPFKQNIHKNLPPINILETKIINIWSEVLGISSTEINANSDFFELGGNSLNATYIVLKLNKQFGVKIGIEYLYKYSSVKKMANILTDFIVHKKSSIKYAEKKEYFHLTLSQKKLFYLWKRNPEKTVYNIPVSLKVNELISQQIVKSVFNKLINRHEMLRSHIIYHNQDIYVIINKKIDFDIQYVEINNDYKLDQIKKTFIKPFNLLSLPCFRITQVNCLSDNYTTILFDIHHIFTDGISLTVLFEEFKLLLNNKKLENNLFTFKDISEWKYKLYNQINKFIDRNFWENQLVDIPRTIIESDFQNEEQNTFLGNTIFFELENKYTNSIKNISIYNKSSIFIILLSAFNILLSKLNNSENVIIGTTVSGRNHNDMQNIFGMFVNTLPIISHIDQFNSFESYSKKLNDLFIKILQHQEFNFEELNDFFVKTNQNKKGQLFNIGFSYQNQYKSDTYNSNNFCIESISDNVSRYDILFIGEEVHNVIKFRVEYCTELYKKETIEKLIYFYKNLLANICLKPSSKIKDLEMIDINFQTDASYANNKIEKLQSNFKF